MTKRKPKITAAPTPRKPKAKARPKRKRPATPTPDNATDALYEKELWSRAFEAFKKEAEGVRLNQQDIAALRRWEDFTVARNFDRYAQRCPQIVLVSLIDSPKKVLLEWQHAGMPRNADRRKTYDLFKVIPWLKARWMKSPLRDNAEALGDARTRKLRAQAELAEVELQVKLEQVVDAAAVQAAYVGLATRVQQRLMAVPAKVSAKCAGHDAAYVRDVVEAAIRDALIELSTDPGVATARP